jgi:hypothetical protein
MDPARKLAATTARNGPTVQPNDAMAYEAPNRVIDQSSRAA